MNYSSAISESAFVFKSALLNDPAFDPDKRARSKTCAASASASTPPSKDWDVIDDDSGWGRKGDAKNVDDVLTDDKSMVDTDQGRRVRVPGPDAYPGEAPYAAPMMGFHGKIAAVFDAFAYLPNGQSPADRPSNFLPIVGLIGDDESKNDNPGWKLFGRLRADVYSRVKEELGDINAGPAKPVLLVTRLRADHMALLSISQPHQMFAQSLWLAALPPSVMKVPMKTLDEPKVFAIVLSERAKVAVAAAQKSGAKLGEQFTMGF